MSATLAAHQLCSQLKALRGRALDAYGEVWPLLQRVSEQERALWLRDDPCGGLRALLGQVVDTLEDIEDPLLEIEHDLEWIVDDLEWSADDLHLKEVADELTEHDE